MAKSLIGIDVGVSELKMALWDGKKIRKLVTVPMLENLVKDGVIVSYDAMADFLKQSIKGSKLTEDVSVILPANYSFLKRLSIPKMTKQQLEVNLPYEFRDFLTQGKDKYFYDYAVNGFNKDEEGEGETMDLLAACSAKDIIGEYRNMFKRAGLRLAVAIPAECAFYNIIKHQAEEADNDKVYAFVDFGCNATKLFIFSGSGYEVTRVIDTGMRTVFEAIAAETNVDEHMALGYMQTNHNNCQELEGPKNVYDAIASEIRKATNFFSFSHSNAELTGLYCCGGGCHIQPLLKAVEEGTELKLHNITELLPEVESGQDPLSFAAAIGAAIQGGR